MSKAIFKRGEVVLEVDERHPEAEVNIDGERIVLIHEINDIGDAMLIDYTLRLAGRPQDEWFAQLNSLLPIGHPQAIVEVAGGTFTHLPGRIQIVRPGEINRSWKE